jgi:hypothetical protein
LKESKHSCCKLSIGPHGIEWSLPGEKMEITVWLAQENYFFY